MSPCGSGGFLLVFVFEAIVTKIFSAAEHFHGFSFQQLCYLDLEILLTSWSRILRTGLSTSDDNGTHGVLRY